MTLRLFPFSRYNQCNLEPVRNNEPPLGVIRKEGEWPLRPKGALNKEGSREQGKRNLGASSTEIWKREQETAKYWTMEQGAREIIREQEKKLKRSREQREMKKEQ